MSTQATSRRVRFGVRSAIILVAVTAICVFAGVIASRLAVRWDVTATREHMLSPRTTELLRELKGGYEVVVAVNGAAIDAASARRTQDVLDSFGRASGNVQVTVVDVSSARGASELDGVLLRLLERYAADARLYRTLIERAAGEREAIGVNMQRLSDRLAQMGAGVPLTEANASTLKKFCTDGAAVSRLIAQDIAVAIKEAQTLGSERIGQTPVPPLDASASTLRSAYQGAAGQLKGVIDGLEAVREANAGTVPETFRGEARELVGTVRDVRDELTRRVAEIDNLPRLPITSVARVLERSSGAIVIGPPGSARGGVTGIDVASVFPARAESSVGVQPDLRARTEDLLTSALTSLSAADTPIVVLVHGTGGRLGPEFPMFKGLVDRLSLRGIDVEEWAVALDADPPPLTRLNPTGTRPVVYAALPAQVENAETAQRMMKLSAAMSRLVSQGRNLLVSVNPSGLPAIGQADPLVSWLEPMGVKVDTGRPLLVQQSTPTGRVVGAEVAFTDPKADHVISGAIRGLATELLWSVPIRIEASLGVAIEPVIRVESLGGAIWGESEWTEFRRIAPQQRSMVANPPAPDTSRDDISGPWTVATAIARTSPSDASRMQRMLVVSSNGWFFDEIAQASVTVDGRPQVIRPGNSELFEASVYWLAEQDRRVSASAQASSVSLIPVVSDGAIGAIRWGLIAGLPLLILLVGVVWRLARG